MGSLHTYWSEAIKLRPGWHRWAVLGMAAFWILITNHYAFEYPSLPSRTGLPYVWLMLIPALLLIAQATYPTNFGWGVISVFLMSFVCREVYEFEMYAESVEGLKGIDWTEYSPTVLKFAPLLDHLIRYTTMLIMLGVPAASLYLLRPRTRVKKGNGQVSAKVSDAS